MCSPAATKLGELAKLLGSGLKAVIALRALFSSAYDLEEVDDMVSEEGLLFIFPLFICADAASWINKQAAIPLEKQPPNDQLYREMAA